MRTGAILLAGGASSRMGRPKPLLMHRGQSFLATILHAIPKSVNRADTVIVGPAELLTPALGTWSGGHIVADTHPGSGPLAGFATGLAALDPAVTHTLLLACDTPRLQTPLLEALITFAQQSGADAVVPRIAERLHPLLSVHRVAACANLVGEVEVGLRRMTDWLDRVVTLSLDETALRDYDPDLVSFENVNTPDDYARLTAESA